MGLDPIDPALFVHGHQRQENWVRRLTREEGADGLDDV